MGWYNFSYWGIINWFLFVLLEIVGNVDLDGVSIVNGMVLIGLFFFVLFEDVDVGVFVGVDIVNGRVCKLNLYIFIKIKLRILICDWSIIVVL